MKKIPNNNKKCLKGKKAINKLLKDKSGCIHEAFYREDIGYIDLIWGDNKMGLQHIIKRRIESGQDLKKLFNNLSEVVETGIMYENESGRLVITDGDIVVVVAPNLYNKKTAFILTAYEKYK